MSAVALWQRLSDANLKMAVVNVATAVRAA